MSILSLNGGCVVAMCGKDCLAIATDHRFGVQAQTLSTDFKKVFQVAPRLFMGITGLQTDILTVRDRLLYRKNIYEMRQKKEMAPESFSSMLSSFLYEHRFGPYFVEPIVAGLDPDSLEPYVCSMDLIGCPNVTDNFVVSGTCAEQLYGMCETLWRPELKPDDLFEVIAQAILNAFDRDAFSGCGATVYLIEEDKLTERTLKTRID